MAQSAATTVDEYLAELPRTVETPLPKCGGVILDNLPEGYQEAMLYG